jgi:hypothetical protein
MSNIIAAQMDPKELKELETLGKSIIPHWTLHDLNYRPISSGKVSIAQT